MAHIGPLTDHAGHDPNTEIGCAVGLARTPMVSMFRLIPGAFQRRRLAVVPGRYETIARGVAGRRPPVLPVLGYLRRVVRGPFICCCWYDAAIPDQQCSRLSAAAGMMPPYHQQCSRLSAAAGMMPPYQQQCSRLSAAAGMMPSYQQQSGVDHASHRETATGPVYPDQEMWELRAQGRCHAGVGRRYGPDRGMAGHEGAALSLV